MALADKIAVMDAGEIQQVGPKDDVYNRPANRFVAWFVGEMNFIEGKVVAVGDGVAKIETKAAVITVANNQVRIGERVELGIRPEKINITKTPTREGENILKAKIVDVNFTGVLTSYEVELQDGTRIKIQTTSRKQEHEIGEHVYVEWSPNDINIYTR